MSWIAGATESTPPPTSLADPLRAAIAATTYCGSRAELSWHRRARARRAEARVLLRPGAAAELLQGHHSAQRPSPSFMSGGQHPRRSRIQRRRLKAERFGEDRSQRRPHWGCSACGEHGNWACKPFCRGCGAPGPQLRHGGRREEAQGSGPGADVQLELGAVGSLRPWEARRRGPARRRPPSRAPSRLHGKLRGSGSEGAPLGRRGRRAHCPRARARRRLERLRSRSLPPSPLRRWSDSGGRRSWRRHWSRTTSMSTRTRRLLLRWSSCQSRRSSAFA